MDIYNYLKKDHRKVAELMEAVVSSKSPSEREELFTEIKYELTLHAETEEKTFYKAVEELTKETEEKIEHAEEEHDEIKKYLKELSSITLSDELWIEKFGEFKHSVSHHVDEEEGQIFEKAKKYIKGKKAEDLAAEMDALKQKKQKKAA